MNNIRFEEVQKEHLEEIIDIYQHYVINTTFTFHKVVPSPDEMWTLVFADHPVYRTFVIMDSDQICGYVILGQHKKREAYDRTAEVSVYLRTDQIGRGIGSLAIKHIEKYAENRGLHVLVATISGENRGSVAAFERNGFTQCAHYREVGQKFGQYLDVVAYQKILK